jgi:hypothetical protein
MKWLALALLMFGGCSSEIDTGDGGSPDQAGVDLVGADLAGRDLAQPIRDLAGGADLAVSCAQVTCGAHAHCDAQSVACVCDPGYGGDPKAGCAAQTPCGMCGAHSYCDAATNTCACDPGYLLANGGCAVAAPADPATRSAADTCALWNAGNVVTDPKPYAPGVMMCDPGTLSRAGIDDTLRRTDMYRALGGLYPITDDAGADADDQACAVMEAANGMLNHMPPMTWTCWTQAGYNGSSTSNIAEGNGLPADAVDLFMDDSTGMPFVFGHRRWLMNPPLDGVGVGFAKGYTCYHVFGGGNMQPSSQWQAVPNQGTTPLPYASFSYWSFDADGVDFTNATVSVVQVSTGAALPVQPLQVPVGYGVNAIAFGRQGWQVAAGESYQVTVDGTSLGAVTYLVQPVNCP